MSRSDRPKGSARAKNHVRPPDYIGYRLEGYPPKQVELYREWYRYPNDPYKILHNVNGPAVIFADGEELWYEDGFPVEAVKEKNGNYTLDSLL